MSVFRQSRSVLRDAISQSMISLRPVRGRGLFELQPIERRVLLAANISGTVFNDINSDGVQNAGEAGLAGWTVFVDANNNGFPDGVEQTQLTDASGFYEFTNLFTPAQHTVRVMVQPGWSQTIPGSGGIILGREGNPGAANDAPAGAAAGPEAPRKASATEIVVAFEGRRGKPVLVERVANDAALRRLVDLDRSQDLFTVQNVTLVEVKLPAGVNPLTAVQRFQSLPGVAWAQPNFIYDEIDPREYVPNDPSYGSQFHHPLMKNNLAWDTTLGSGSIKIGITDDGVLTTHPDLAPNLWVNPGEIPGNGVDDDGNGYIDDVNGWDVWNNDNNPNPSSASFDHGTHVAGIAAARIDNGVGVAGVSNASIVPIRFYNGSGWTSTIVSNAYRYAADAGVHIVNTSYNVDGFTNDNIFAAGLQYMYDHGVLHFNSAGNNGQLNPPRQKWDQTLFVVNTQSNDTRNSGSNYGWGVDVSAPGTSILSTSIGSSLTAPNYEVKTGTSMATPNAAGVAALIWSLHPEWTREQVAAQLLGTADNIDAQNPSIAGLLGAGRTNSFRALTEALKPPKMKSLANLPADGAFTTVKPISFTLDVANVFDPDTVNLSNFELRGAGIDGVFNTSDDLLVPITLTFGSSFGSTYMIGTNRLNFTVPGTMPADTYRFAALPGLTDPFGQSIDGNGDGTSGDAFTRTFTLVVASNPYRVNLADGQNVTNAHFGNHDIAPPRALVSQFAFATEHSLVVQFNEDVSGSLSLADLALQNVTTNQPVDTSGFTLSWNSANNTATIQMNSILPDASFRATFAAAGITDISGNILDGNGNGVGGDDLVVDFFFLRGDANHDGAVNLADFNILAMHFGESGTDFTEGDFNYDGQTNLDDFNILAARFGQSVTGRSGATSTSSETSPTLAGATTFSSTRIGRAASLTMAKANPIDSLLDDSTETPLFI